LFAMAAAVLAITLLSVTTTSVPFVSEGVPAFVPQD